MSDTNIRVFSDLLVIEGMRTIAARKELELRTLRFAIACRDFWKRLPRSLPNGIYGRQLLRSSSSIGANYLEADDALGRKDAAMHIRISVKEAKESTFWFRLLDIQNRAELETQRAALINEAQQLLKILASIMWRLKGNKKG